MLRPSAQLAYAQLDNQLDWQVNWNSNCERSDNGEVASFFSVSTDDTSDNGYAEQLNLSVCLMKSIKINEEFLFRGTYFLNSGSTSGFDITKCVASWTWLKIFHGDKDTMESPNVRCLQIKQEYSCHISLQWMRIAQCCSYVGNLVVSDVSQLTSMWNAMGFCESFYESSSKQKQQHLLKKVHICLCAKQAMDWWLDVHQVKD